MRRILLCSLFLLTALSGAQAQGEGFATRSERYIRRYKDLAMAEQRRAGIPAAITLAQGIHETSAGASELAVEAANHFGIKCKKSWTGPTYYHDDDKPDECFRKYENAEGSYRDHSDYLKSNPRYAACFQQSITDYAAWAFELRKAGYATNPAYAQRLIKLIEDYRLQEFTYAAMDSSAPTAPLAGEVVPERDATPPAPPPAARPAPPPAPASSPLDDGKRNGLRGFYARRGDVLLEAAIRHRIRYARLLDLNDLPDAPLAADMFIYLEPKRDRGISAAHTVRAGETLHGVSQDEGIRLRALTNYNNLEMEAPLEEGTVLRLVPPSGIVARINEDVTTTSPATAVPPAETPEAPPAPAASTPDLGMPVEPRESRERAGRPPAASTAVAAPAEEETVEAEPPATADAGTPPGTVREEPSAPTPPAATTTPATPAEAPPAATPDATPAAPPAEAIPAEDRAVEGAVNIADEPAVEEAPQTESTPPPADPADPADPMARLKSRFDDAIYSPAKTPAAPAKTPAASKGSAAQAPAPVPPAAPPAAASGKTHYTVRKGDTAFSIARAHGLTIKQLRSLNNLEFDKGIQAGQKLRVK